MKNPIPHHPTLPSQHVQEDKRYTRRPTVSIPQIDPNRLQEAIFGVFRKYDYNAMDLEALIYFSMQALTVEPNTYEGMYKAMRAYILKNFAIEQGSFIGYAEFSMHRLLICYTDNSSDYESKR